MKRIAWIAVFTLSLAAVAGAQEGLTPTDVLDYGKITGTMRLSYAAASGGASSPLIPLDMDLDITMIAGQLDFAGGLGQGFEAELSVPFSFQEKTEGDGDVGGSPGTLEDEVSGLGDMTLIGNYRIFKDTPSTPHWMAGAILVLPIGDDDISEPEVTVGGVPVSEGKKGGIGEGVFKLGAQTGISRKFGTAEPYALIGYLFPLGEHEDGDIEVDVAGIFRTTLGSEFEVTKDVVIDTRLILDWKGEQVTEELGDKETEEAFLTAQFQAEAYIQLGSGLTALAGVQLLWMQDHAVNEEEEMDIEDVLGYGFLVGVHYVFDATK